MLMLLLVVMLLQVLIDDVVFGGGVVVGGGDVVSAVTNAGLSNNFTYISTGGGAFLEWMEGKTLPGVEILYNNP